MSLEIMLVAGAFIDDPWAKDGDSISSRGMTLRPFEPPVYGMKVSIFVGSSMDILTALSQDSLSLCFA